MLLWRARYSTDRRSHAWMPCLTLGLSVRYFSNRLLTSCRDHGRSRIYALKNHNRSQYQVGNTNGYRNNYDQYSCTVYDISSSESDNFFPITGEDEVFKVNQAEFLWMRKEYLMKNRNRLAYGWSSDRGLCSRNGTRSSIVISLTGAALSSRIMGLSTFCYLRGHTLWLFCQPLFSILTEKLGGFDNWDRKNYGKERAYDSESL